jgi:hypothetical protein
MKLSLHAERYRELRAERGSKSRGATRDPVNLAPVSVAGDRTDDTSCVDDSHASAVGDVETPVRAEGNLRHLRQIRLVGGPTVAREPDSSVASHDPKSTIVQANEDSVVSDVDDVQPSIRAHGEWTREAE